MGTEAAMATTQTTEKQIIDLERQFWQAIKDRDFAAARRLTDFPCRARSHGHRKRMSSRNVATTSSPSESGARE
jgi:hypothetical protein